MKSNVEVSQWHVTLLIPTLAQQEFPVPMLFAKQKSLQGHSCTRILLPKKNQCLCLNYLLFIHLLTAFHNSDYTG